MSRATQAEVPDVDGMPALGLGTWQNAEPEPCRAAVKTALEMGYRHIDTAQAYRNEQSVGDGIAAADVDRDEVFLATKVWIENLGYDDVIATTEDSLDRLGVDSVDLLYVHWPNGEYDPADTLRAFEELSDEGRIDRLGVSNFQPAHLEEAVDRTDVPIFANQIELHPLVQQRELRAVCAELDVAVVAYSPLARGRVFDVPELESIADKHGVTPAQVSLAWLREKGVTAIPKATSTAHIRDNWQSLSLSLDPEDVTTIDAIDRFDRHVDPDWAPWHDGPAFGE
jgi:2,5-diketo-D-gluconate reductase B